MVKRGSHFNIEYFKLNIWDIFEVETMHHLINLILLKQLRSFKKSQV